MSNKSIAPMTILGIDTDAGLNVSNAAAARRKQIALGALTLYHENVDRVVRPRTGDTVDDVLGKLTAKRMVDLINRAH
jgi:hypothetical protein